MSGLEGCWFSFELQNTNGFGIDQQECIFHNRSTADHELCGYSSGTKAIFQGQMVRLLIAVNWHRGSK